LDDRRREARGLRRADVAAIPPADALAPLRRRARSARLSRRAARLVHPRRVGRHRRGGGRRARAPAIVVEHAQAPAPDDGPEVDGVSYASALAAIDLPGKAVAVWLAYRQALGQRAPAERVAAWEAIAARVAEVGKMASSKAGSTWLKRAIAEEDARAAIVQPAPEAT
jgi:hypothetical protein